MIAIRNIILILLFNNLALAQTPDVETSNPRDTGNIQFSGNSYYSANSLRTGLRLDRAVQLSKADQLSSERYAELICKRITRGYLNNGFRDVQVSAVADPVTHTITATITEGQSWKKRNVIVTGLSERECEYVASLLKQGNSNALQKVQPRLQYWNNGAATSFAEALESSWKKTVTEALTEIGFPLAEFTLTFPATSEGDKYTIDLQVTVTDTGPALNVGAITFTGLEKHTPEPMLEYLGLKSGMPLTLMLREEIVSKLLKSGRFLMAEVTNDLFLFDPAEPLNLNIRVREYDLVAPIGEELTEVQQTLLKTSEWLSKWGNGGEDLHLKCIGPNEQANEVVKAFVPQEYHSFCDPALGTGIPGTLCVDLMTSPNVGSVLTLQVIDAQGTASMRRTILLTNSMQGLLAWQNKKKWLHANDVSVVCNFDIAGQWGGKDAQRARLMFGYGINSKPSKGVRSDFETTAAAVLHIVNYGPPETLTEGDLCRLTWPNGKCELDRNNGAIRNVSVTKDNASIEVTTGVGLVETELARLGEETKDWTNQCQPGREWTALATMLLEDVRAADPENSDTCLLLLDLLSDEAAIKHFGQAIAEFEQRRAFHIPQENISVKGHVTGLLSWLPFVSECIPAGSFLHRVGLTWHEAANTGNSELFQSVLLESLQKNDDGAVCCELMTHLYPKSQVGVAFAKAGLERLSTEEFQRDVAPFVNQPGAAHEVICGLLAWLQHTTDEDAEKLATLVADHVTDKNAQPVNIRPLLVLIRSQREKPVEDVLTSLVPFVWEAGLRDWVEADLKRCAETPPEKAKKYFSSTTNEVFKNANLKDDPKDDEKDKRTKRISHSNSIKDINFDEQWDLDK